MHGAAAKFLDLSDELSAMGSEGSLRQALKDLVAMLEALKVPFALFGALAVGAYVEERRSTLDVDIVSPQEGIEKIRAHAGEFGFTENPGQAADARMVTFTHKNGAVVDVLNSQGFADLERVTMAEFPGIGTVPVASVYDLVEAKLRTQLPTWRPARTTEKRLIDRADITAMLRQHPEVLDEVYRKLVRSRSDHNEAMIALIAEISREANLALPNEVLSKSWKVWLALAAALVAIVAACIGVIALLSSWK